MMTYDDALVLSIDLGTSSARAALYDAHGSMVPGTLHFLHHAPSTTRDGGSELDPDEMLAQVISVVDGTLSTKPGGQVRAVATSTFWHSLMGVDAAGSPLTPVYTWADTRAAVVLPLFESLLDAGALYRRTGAPPHPSFLPEKLLWLRETQPDLFESVHRWMSLGEYIQSRILGDVACGEGMASGTGLYDQVERRWDPEALKAIGVDADRLSPLVPSSEGLGALVAPYRERWPALADVIWYPAIGDGACSNFGSGAASPGTVAINFGTSGAIRTVVEEYVDFPYGLWVYRIDDKRLLLGGALSNAGNVHEWLLDTLRLDAAETEEALIHRDPGKTGLSFDPNLAGERSPGWTPDATGTLTGLRLDSTPMDIFMAGIEGVVVEFLRVHNMLVSTVGEPEEVILSGGAIRSSPGLRQALTDALGYPTRTSLDAEASARGAALLALEALGVIADAATVQIEKSTPEAPDAKRHSIYRSLERHRRPTTPVEDEER